MSPLSGWVLRVAVGGSAPRPRPRRARSPPPPPPGTLLCDGAVMRTVPAFCPVSALFSLSDTFCQKVFDLSVYGTEIILCPGGNVFVERFGQPERDLFLFGISHISTGFPRLRQERLHGCRRAPPGDWRPSLLSAHHPVQRSVFLPDVPAPFLPFPQRRLRSFSGRR